MDGLTAVPHVWMLAAATAAAIVGEILLWKTAARRLRAQRELGRQAGAGGWGNLAPPPIPPRWPEILGALAPLVVVGLVVAALQASRQMMLGGPSVDLSEKAVMLSRGISGAVNGTLFGLYAVIAATGLAGVAVPLAVAARLRARGLHRAAGLSATTPDEAAAWTRHPGPAGGLLVAATLTYLVLGLGPIVRAAFLAIAARVHAFAAMSGVDPGLKPMMFRQHLDETAAQMQVGLLLARIGLVAATIVAATLAVTGSPARARARALGRPCKPAGSGTVVLALVFLLLAGAAFGLARPFQRENDLPWPETSENDVSLASGAATPALAGPDPIERAPLIAVGTARTELDGRGVEPGELEESLDVLHNNYRLLHPGGLFNRQVLVACAPEVTRDRLLPVLATALRTGYERPSLLFLRQEVTDRPLLGTLRRTSGTGASFVLVPGRDEAEEGSVILEGPKLTTCQDLAARLVDLRRQGKTVAVLVPR